jgi:glycosyltransferase involved in cell wall biosynthesis
MIEALINQFDFENVIVIVPFKLEYKPFKYIQTKLQPYNLIDFIRFSYFILKIDFSILYSPFYSSTLFKQKKKVYIITVHDLMYQKIQLFSENKIVNYLGIKYYNFIVRNSLKNSTIISVSKTTQNDVFDFVKCESFLIREGINRLNYFNQQPAPNGIIASEYFLYVGNLRRHKNIEFLISAFLKSKTNRKLIICGNYKKPLQYDSNRISFLGYVDDSTLAELYKNCTAFIFPSLYEGFGLPILEALSFGVNVYSSNTGALSEFSDEFITFFNPQKEDELIKLLEIKKPSPIDLDRLSDYLESFSWQNVQADFLKIVNKTFYS